MFSTETLGCGVLNPGYEVVVTDTASGEQKSLVIDELFISSFDLGSDVVQGTAAPGATVLVSVADRWHSHEFEVTADSSGDWSANFATEGFDTIDGMEATARIFDTDGDFTSAIASPGHTSNDIFMVTAHG